MATDASTNSDSPTLSEQSVGDNNRPRRGAPWRNRNGLRHGLTTCALPKGCGWIVRQINELRRALEDAVMQQHGEVRILHAASTQSAVKWERHSMLSLRWLRLKQDDLTNSEVLAFSREAAKASSERDRCLARLSLGVAVDDVLDSLYIAAVPPDGAHDEPESDD